MHPSSEPVRLEAYSPTRPQRYEVERVALSQVLDGVIVDLQHIGSTSVPGLAAKPTIDILLGTKEWPWPTEKEGDLEQLRYSFYKAPEEKWRVYVKPWRNRQRGYHLHVVEHGSEHWRRHLLFRDYLRSHVDEARRYETGAGADPLQ